MVLELCFEPEFLLALVVIQAKRCSRLSVTKFIRSMHTFDLLPISSPSHVRALDRATFVLLYRPVLMFVSQIRCSPV